MAANDSTRHIWGLPGLGKTKGMKARNSKIESFDILKIEDFYSAFLTYVSLESRSLKVSSSQLLETNCKITILT